MQKTILMGVLGVAFLTANAVAQSGGGGGFPEMELGKGARGSEIIRALGSRLPEVARHYGMTESQLGALALSDRDLRSDRHGRLLYACEGLTAQAPTAGNAATNGLLNYPESETFLLHSKPGLSRVIYLDFTGHTTSGTSWNTAYKSGADIITPPYDTDGIPTVFSAVELANLQQIWKRVSEDYAPWDVDVTTEEPPLESLRKTSTTDTAYGIRMVIGGTSYELLGVGAGGVAYLQSFGWNSDTPAFVFPPQLGNGYPKYVAEAISHEAGHTVALRHDGLTDGTGYYQGHNGWAPIMGVGYYASITQFSKGEYANANNLEDDTAIINGYIPRSADLAGNDILTAVPLTGTSIAATGMIDSRTDVDLYRVNVGAGTVSFTAGTASPDANLDIGLALYNGTGNLVASADSSTLGASLSSVVAAGTYYLAVDGVGTGTASTGYTDYASLGQFTLTGSVPASVGQPPVAVVSQSTPVTGTVPLTVHFSSAGSSDAEGSALAYDWDFGDGTAGSAEANPVHVYSAVGTYTASLAVFDNTGLSGTASVVIAVKDVVVVTPVLSVSDIAMSKVKTPKGTQAKAVVTVRDGTGAVVANATVTGSWSGVTMSNVSGLTGTAGTASFTSSATKQAGTFTFKVTGVSLSGYTYDPTKNVETTDSIVK